MSLFGSTPRIALRNLGRSRRRTALAVGAIAVAQFGVLAMNGYLNGRADWTIDSITGPMMGHVQVHAPDWRREQAADLVIDDVGARLAAVQAVEGVESAYARIYSPVLAAREIDGHAAIVVGIDTAREVEAGGLLEGLPTSEIPEGHDVLVGRSLAQQTGIEVGDELALLGQAADGSMANDLVRVVGIIRSPVERVDATGIVMSLALAQEIFVMPDMAHEITVRGSGSGEHAPAVAARIAALPEMAGLETLPWRVLAPELAASVEQSAAMGLVVVFIVFIAAAAGVTNTMLMATFERRRELAVLLALGTTPGRLVRMILVEAVALGFLGVLVGSLLGGAFVAWLGTQGVSIAPGADAESVSAFGLTFNGLLWPHLAPGDYLPGIVGVSVVSVLAAVWPAALTARLEPMEGMRS